MKAVTSSHSITFMCQLSEKYSESEIIFGHPESLGNQQLDIIKIQGFQADIIKILSKQGNAKRIISNISSGSTKLLFQETSYHMKMYFSCKRPMAISE